MLQLSIHWEDILEWILKLLEKSRILKQLVAGVASETMRGYSVGMAGKWHKLKGVAYVRLVDGSVRLAEVHWYQADNIGKREFKIKLPFLD